jgi:hypothetical protein
MSPCYAQNLTVIKPMSDKVFTLVGIYHSRTLLVAYERELEPILISLLQLRASFFVFFNASTITLWRLKRSLLRRSVS